MTEREQDAFSVSICAGETNTAITMMAPLFLRFLTQATESHSQGLKSFGLFFADSEAAPHCHRPKDVYFCDAAKNRRNDREHRPGFEAQGAYFRRYDDAGFVADSREVFRVHETARARGVSPVGLFHSHRRQPANFSSIDYRLHSPFYTWHLVLSLREPSRPVVQAFFVEKPFDDYGLDDAHVVEDEGELPYTGPEVKAARLVVTGGADEIMRVRSAMWRHTYVASAACLGGVP